MRKLPLAAVSTVLGLALAVGSIAPYVAAPEAEAAGRAATKSAAKKTAAKKPGPAKAPAKTAKASASGEAGKSCGTFFYRKDGKCVDARAKAK